VALAVGVGLLSLAGVGGRAWFEGRAAASARGPTLVSNGAARASVSPEPPAQPLSLPSERPSSSEPPAGVRPSSDEQKLPGEPPASAKPASLARSEAAATRNAPGALAASRPSRAPSAPDLRPNRSISAVTAASVAHLELTADPAAWVEVDTVRVGRTPLPRHAVSPGRHAITFVNQLLGERLEATVSVDASHPARVHADFSSANPRVYVR